jgi:hypothetical protein
LKTFLAALALLLISAPAHSQTISPLITECGKKCSGSFTLTNNGLIPLAATLESFQFSLDSSGQHFRNLDTARVILSETSARLGPREAREINYKILCNATPCEVAILATMVVGNTKNSSGTGVIQVRLALQETVYACEKSKNCRRSILDAAGLQAHK